MSEHPNPAASLRASEEEYRLLVSSIQDYAIYMLDPEGRVASWNAGAGRIKGYSEREILGEHFSRFHTAEDVAAGRPGRLLELAASRGRYHEEGWRRRKDGSLFWADVTLTALRDEGGRLRGFAKVTRDLTGRKEAEEVLTRQAATLREQARLLELAHDAIMVRDPDGVISYWSRGAEQHYGWPAALAVGRCSHELLKTEFPEPLGRIAARLGDEGHWEGELVHTRRDGSRLVVDSRWDLRRDERGRPAAVLEINSDITERKRAEAQRAELIRAEAAREAAEAGGRRYRALAEAIPQMVWTALPDGRRDFTNRRWSDYTGLGPDWYDGQAWQTAVHPDDLARCLARWERSLRTGEPFDCEYRLRRAADGAYRWHLVRALAVRDEAGRIERWIGTSTDIDDRRRAEESARFLAEASGVLAGSLDAEATLTDVARLAVPRLADWCLIDLAGPDGSRRRLAVAHADPAREALGRDLDAALAAAVPTDRGPDEVLASGRPQLVAELAEEAVAAYCPDPELARRLPGLGLRSFLSAPLTARGKTLGALTLLMAESGRRFGPLDLATAEDLARRAALAVDNARLHRSEQDARREAEAANQAKDRFLAMLSHELRTPLTPVLVSVSALADESTTPAEMRPLLDLIRRDVELEARLIDDLLDVTRISRGTLTITPEVVDAHAILARALEISRSEVFAGGLRTRLALEAEAHHVLADPARLQQVFWNLFKNAAKYSPGGGTLTVRSRNEGDGPAPRLIVEVSDEGIGIEPQYLPRLFHAFERGDPEVARRFGGLGLGLAICRTVVEAHGGRLSAHSEGRGRGTTFRVELETVPAPPPDGRGREPAGSEPAEARSLTLLLVEDDRDTRQVLTRLLQKRGFAVRTADTVDAAVREASAGPFDVLVSDIGLPDGTGLEVIRRLRAARPVPGIALSGFGMDEDLHRSREAGFTAHLTKPVDIQKLEAAIRRAASAPADAPGPTAAPP